MQKTEHEGSFNAMYRKSSLPSIGTEIETEDPLKIVSQWLEPQLNQQAPQAIDLNNTE